MIPQIIHYCWFGGNPLPASAEKCIDSWRRFFPGWEICEWNESNFNLDLMPYIREAYDTKKYAFVTDAARLYLVYTYGGIYFDVDVEVIKSFDAVLQNSAFFGLETDGKMNTGLGFGAESQNETVKAILDSYADRHYVSDTGKQDLSPCPVTNSVVMKNLGFSLNNQTQSINGATVYPADWFNPQGGYGLPVNVTANTLSIHHFDGSWLPAEEKARAEKLKRLKVKYGDKKAKLLYNTVYMPYRIISNIKEKINH